MRKTFVAIVFAIALAATTVGQKLTAEEVVSRHLQSIGSDEARKTARTRIISGGSTVAFLTEPKGQATGRAVLASDGPKNLIGLSFPSPIYPREQFGYDGNSFMAAFVTPGVRSSLGSFLMTHTLIFRQGLMGGALSSAWPLLSMSSNAAKLEDGGEKKVDNRILHMLNYHPKGGGDLQIHLYFDDAFHHVRTEYLRVIPAQTGSRAYTNVEEREIRYKMVEEFSEFKAESGLTLPHKYEIKFSVDSTGGTFSGEWKIDLNKFTFNEPIDPAAFTISGN